MASLTKHSLSFMQVDLILTAKRVLNNNRTLMVRLIVSYLPIYCNENLPNKKKVAKVGSTFCQILNIPTKILPMAFKFLPK